MELVGEPERLSLFARIRHTLPEGRALPEDAWRRRHRLFVVLVWFHAAVIPIFGLLRGYSPVHVFLEGMPTASAGVLAMSSHVSRRTRMAASTLGLLLASAV